jgi:hypothetical protein
MTLTGTLTDYEGDVARVNDKPLKMLPAAAKWCRERLKKGMVVDYDLVDSGERKGWIAKMWERKPGAVIDIAGDAVEKAKEKMAKAGFTVPEQGNTSDSCTSPKTPASEFWEVLGVVETIDTANRKATVSDEDGIIHPLVWAAGYLDEKVAKLKPGYYRKFSGEAAKPDIVTAIGWLGKDEPDWVKARYKALRPSGGGGWKGAPKNDKAILFQVLLKGALDLMIRGMPEGQGVDLRKDLGTCIQIAEEKLPDALKAAGVP